MRERKAGGGRLLALGIPAGCELSWVKNKITLVQRIVHVTAVVWFMFMVWQNDSSREKDREPIVAFWNPRACGTPERRCGQRYIGTEPHQPITR